MQDRARVAESTAARAQLGPPLYEREGLLREAWKELRELKRYRELVGYMVSSSLKVETARTVLGSIWWLLDPLLLAVVYFIFVDVILERGGEDFEVYLLISVVVWKQFSSGCGRAMGNTAGHQELMKQVRFPRAVLPLSAVLAVTVHFVVGLVVLIGAAAFFGLYPSLALLLLPVVVAIQLILTLGFSFLFAGVNFFFRDLQPMVAYLLTAWFFLSPTLYTIDQVPESLRPLYDANPFTYLLDAYHTILMDGSAPDFGPLALVAGGGLVLLALGYLLFVRLEQSFTKVS